MRIFVLFFALLLTACCHKPQASNHVYQYLTGAEFQCETRAQKEEIHQALSDMLNLPPDQLKRKRYKNYKGIREWSAHTLIEKHFVPDSRKFLDQETFYEELKDPYTKERVREWLEKVERMRDYHS